VKRVEDGVLDYTYGRVRARIGSYIWNRVSGRVWDNVWASVVDQTWGRVRDWDHARRQP
jgi:hypothetical protein